MSSEELSRVRNRFHALCPYFAMFPEAFAEQWIERLTKPGEIVLDPFCGRGTAPFQAILMDRRAIGNDINPVAYCLTQAKLGAPTSKAVLRRIGFLERAFDSRVWEPRRRVMPPFFHVAFSRGTLRQLLFLRAELKWRHSRVDAMIAALVLGSLHGESERSPSYLSNQMPRTISTKPDYSLRFWERHGYTAPERDVFALLRDRVAFRYESELPRGAGEVYNADMRDLPRLPLRGPIKLAITSPPYLDVTDFGEDQWLRVWLLGGASYPTRRVVSRDDRHYGADNYWRLIADMWRVLGMVLAPKATVVIRIGGSRLSPDQVLSALTGSAKVSSRKISLVEHSVSEIVRRQTDAFRPGTTGCRHEVDALFAVA
jgi:DNA methylase